MLLSKEETIEAIIAELSDTDDQKTYLSNLWKELHGTDKV